MKVKIDIETQTFVRFGLVIIGFALTLLAIYLTQDALMSIGISLFLALALNPPVTRLARKLPGKSRIGATALSYLIVLTILGALIFLIVPPIVEQTAKFTETVPSLIDKVASLRVVFDDFITRFSLQVPVDQAIEGLKEQAAGFSTQLGGALVGIVTGAASGLVSLIFVLVITFFMLVEGPLWISKIWDLYEDPEKLERHRATVQKMYKVVTGFVSGQIIIAFIGAMFAFVALLIMGAIPALDVPPNLAIPLSVIIFFFAFIPMIGSTIGGILACLVLLLNSPLAALVFGIYFIIYQQIENNVIAPPVQSKLVDLSVLWTLIAILIGASLFGLIGGLISIPIAGCLRVLLTDYLEHTKKERARNAKRGVASKLLKKITE